MSGLDELRARIERLNRGPLAEPPPPIPKRRSDVDEGHARGRGYIAAGSLEELIPGREAWAENGERAYLIETPVESLHRDGADVTVGFEEHFAEVEGYVKARTRRRASEGELRPEDVVYLDIETTGLSPTGPVFLVGLMVRDGVGWVVRQFLARDEDEEGAILALCAVVLRERHALVSFNGIQFDLSYLRARAQTVGVPFEAPYCHLDLLFESRRTWRRRVPNCKLQTLESHLCGRTRTGDIAGHRIPSAYRAFLRSGDAREMKAIVYHNALDLFTLADLLTRLACEHRDASASETPATRSRTRPDRR